MKIKRCSLKITTDATTGKRQQTKRQNDDELEQGEDELEVTARQQQQGNENKLQVERKMKMGLRGSNMSTSR
jgi:hypothetical protein